jgi:RNA polymerase sigma factor (sigma-70 family)
MVEPIAVSTTPADDLTDAVLLERYTSRREDAAFAVLVRRYSPLVLSVCPRVLQHDQDAEDAFQAVFCVLARKAASIRQGAAIGAWLHAVVYRIAHKARASRRRRPVLTSNLADIPAAEDSPEWAWKELRPILDAEVNRLPTKCRQAFVLCYLEGLTNEQAAAQLGCPQGTVMSRLAQARERHADRTPGSDRHHWGFDRIASAGGGEGPRGRPGHPVCEQPETDRVGPSTATTT